MNSVRTIVITGCSRGLGRALVEEFAKAGHVVVGCARSAKTRQQLSEHFASPHHFTALDVSDEPAVQAWSQRVIDEVGVPDLVINNAAIINTPAPLWEVPAAEFRELLEVNITGVHLVTRYLLPPMIDAGTGVLINLSSGWGRSVAPEMGPYCASKWAIEGMTKALASELPAGLAAIPLSPGVIATDMLRGIWGDAADGFRTPAQWAASAAPFILGLDASNNGQSLTTPDNT